ncbi:MAG: zinc-binding dehydrogenase, partial [Bdellovibrionaceae bacterium]|nr:zinc-binding dehydrogenase [Pseudobdellovibrionaceae bacterium]
MKAWIVEKHGAISDTKSLILKEKEEPVLQQGKALVEVHYCSLNHLDLWVRKGVPGHSFPLPLIPGCDVSGRITAVDSKEWSVGDAVVIQPVIFCGKCRNCKKKWISACENFGLFGETVDGGLTQKILVDLKQLVKIPDSVSLEQAACLPVAYMTAYQMLHRRAQIQKGDLILVQAGGSGVSVACIQIAKSIGAKVIATVGSPEKAKLLESLGVDEVILYR